jgi:hemolysin activation/secretion protein
VPSIAEPSIIMKGLQEEKRATSRLEDVIVAPKDADGKGLSTQKVFVLKSVVLDGSTAYKGADMSPLFKDMIGQQVSFADLNKIAQQVTRKYREDGYIFSRAVLPPQKVKDGVVHLNAIEGRIANVKLVGNFKDGTGLIQRMADKIKSSNAANTREIERYLLLIDDLPGITAKSFIEPSKTQGSGDLIIDVQEDMYEGSLGFDNRGSRTIGPYKGTAVGAVNSGLGLHDRTTLRGILATQPQELKFFDLTHEEQIGAEGFKLKARAAVTKSNAGGNVSTQNIQGDSRLFDLEGSFPVLRSRKYNVNLIAGFDALNSNTDVLGVQVAHDHVRSLRAGTSVDFTDSFKGVNQFDVMATQGVDILGATDNGTGRSRANGKHNFLKGDITATRIQELADKFSLMLSGTGQVSRDSLLSSEQFTIGGQSFGRGYDSGEISGDAGWATVAELRYGGAVNTQYVQSYQAYSFIDYGRTKLKVPGAGEAKKDSLTSAGLGVRFNLAHDFSGYIELDTPLTKKVASEGDNDSRLFFNILKRF